jgi:hypothetical protein
MKTNILIFILILKFIGVREGNGGIDSACTAKTKYRNFETNIPRKGISGTQSQFPHDASVRDLYIPTIGLPILLQEI